ncbi:hypothetical protein [Fulvivirga imtechensis]|nr:hypothetical protein [Fulvivirga imtechensis]
MTNTKIIDEKSPIGAWVREADTVFTHLTRRTRNHGSFNRIEWQLLNFIHEKESALATESKMLLNFFDSDEVTDQVIMRFVKDGLIMEDHERIRITAKGRRAYAEVSQIQEEIKRKAMAGVSEKEYATTIATLRKVIDNLREYAT